MILFYLNEVRPADAHVEVVCPACGERQLVFRSDFEAMRWRVRCARCGATYGAVSQAIFRELVHAEWTDQKKGADIDYVDVFIVRSGYLTQGRGSEIAIQRWHGWVDRESRKIVQEG
jgi:predicted Zn finger-like uncharacterized protein